MLRRFLIIPLLLLLILVPVSTAQDDEIDFTDYATVMDEMVNITVDTYLSRSPVGAGFYEQVGESGDPLYIAPLVDVLYFSFGIASREIEIYGALEHLTGVRPINGWRTYLEWASENDVALPPGYDDFKGKLFGDLIDPEFAEFFVNTQDTAQVNLVEAVWGGVTVDGIPSLVNARQISPDEALVEGSENARFCTSSCEYPLQDEFVFGVYVDGDARAYPLRIMNWHEMFNDVIGHTPMYTEPNGEFVCNFRAPTVFSATARDGEDWVFIRGTSAGCDPEGWVSAEDVEWVNGSWETVRDDLPDVSVGEEALSPANGDFGISGRVSGRPVMLAYCTLCGAGILYDVTIPDLTYTDRDDELVEAGETTLEFGSTGMLMRSNKLMYDRTTNTVWNAFTGIPAFGPLASTEIELPLLPVVVTTWSDWLEDHPDTSVLSLNTGHSRNYRNGAAYSDYFNSSDLMFPSFQQNTEVIENKQMVFGLNFDDNPRAYPLEVLFVDPIVNDTLADVDVVIISETLPERSFFEPGGAAVRAYERDGLIFELGESEGEVVDDTGVIWEITEDALINPDGERLERVAGHLAFWFGWFGFYPETDLYTPNIQ